jgi:flagellar basal body P-ring formation protein FlgA
MNMIRAVLIALAILALPALANLALADSVGDVRVVVPNRTIARGETISEADLIYATIPAGQMQSGIITSVNDLEGMEARRVLRPDETVRNDDVRHPILVTKGQTVTMTFNAPGITLTAVGKATSEGGMGEMVTVLNPVSYRQITCTVTGSGTVQAGSTMTNVGNAQVAAN